MSVLCKFLFRCIRRGWLAKIYLLSLMAMITVISDHVVRWMSALEQSNLASYAMASAAERPKSLVLPKPPLQSNLNVTNTSLAAQPTIKVVKVTKASATNGKPILPNLLLIGAPHAGTTALAGWMLRGGACTGSRFKSEPDWMGGKEMHFFDIDTRYSRGNDFYKQRFSHCYTTTRKYKFRLDATPNTLMHPERVYETYKNVRNLRKLNIIVVLREPIEREMAGYLQMLSLYQKNPDPNAWYATAIHRETGYEKSFSEYLDTVTLPALKANTTDTVVSYYAQYLTRWFQLFDPTQILILNFESDMVHSIKAKERVEKFLNVSFIYPNFNFAGLEPRTDVSCAVLKRVAPLFEPYNQQLRELLQGHPRPPMEQSPFPRFQPKCQEDRIDLDAYMAALNRIE